MNLTQLGAEFPAPNADFYVCGPKPFMQTQMAVLREMGVSDARIHAEAFGTGGV